MLKEQYITAWEEACKNRMYLPSRGDGNGAYGVCDNKNEVSTVSPCVCVLMYVSNACIFITLSFFFNVYSIG